MTKAIRLVASAPNSCMAMAIAAIPVAPSLQQLDNNVQLIRHRRQRLLCDIPSKLLTNTVPS